MRLTDVLALEGIKLIDTNILNGDISRIELARYGMSLLEQRVKELKQGRIAIQSSEDTFFVKGTGLELRRYLACLKRMQESFRRKNPGYKIYKGIIVKDSRVKSEREKILQQLITQTARTLKFISLRLIEESFNSPELLAEFELWRRRLEASPSSNPSLSPDYKNNYVDRSIVSAALVVARELPVVIVSRDHHIGDMLHFLGRLELENPLSFYSDTGDYVRGRYSWNFKKIYPLPSHPQHTQTSAYGAEALA